MASFQDVQVPKDEAIFPSECCCNQTKERLSERKARIMMN